jgi:TPR repeat protein
MAWHCYKAASDQDDIRAATKLLMLHWMAKSSFMYHVPTLNEADHEALAARVIPKAQEAADNRDWDMVATLSTVRLFENLTSAGHEENAAALLKGALAGDAACMAMTAFFQDRLEVSHSDNPHTAVHWYELAVEMGHSEAHWILGKMHLHGRVVTKNIDRALDHFEISARLGVSDAALQLADCYERGIGVAKDLVQSVFWLRLAALGECPDALFALAVHKYKFPDSIVEPDEADRCLREACRRGHTTAMMKLADDLLRSPPSSEDFESGVKLVKTVLSRHGEINTDYVLGHIHRHGIGVKEDKAKAAEYWRLSANAGDVTAQVFYGDLLLKGDGVPVNMELAEHYFELALSQRHLAGAIGIGFVARFLHRDDAKAAAYLAFGSTGKEREAAELCRKIVLRMNKEELDKAWKIRRSLEARFSN